MHLPWRWLPGLPLALSAVAPCGASEALPASLRACVVETDADRRLACYDKEVARLINEQEHSDVVPPAEAGSAAQSHQAIEPRPDAGLHGPKRSSAEDQFGGRPKDAGGEPKLQRLQARIVTISYRPRGRLGLGLDNGQVWEQSEEGPDLKLKVGDVVTIQTGLLGAYWLSAYSHRAIKVQRTR